MNIAIFTDTYEPQVNGVVSSSMTLKNSFEAIGHRVFVFAPSIKGFVDKNEDVFRFSSVPYPFLKEHRLVLPLSRQLKDFSKLKIDVIHLQTPFSLGLLGLYLAKRHHIPVVHTYHTFFKAYLHYVPFVPKRFHEKGVALQARQFCNKCDAIVAPSHPMKEALLDYGVSVPISVIPSGIDRPKLSSGHLDTISKHYVIDKSKPNFIYVGRLALEKNLFFLLRAFDLIQKELPKATLYLVGDGPIKDELISMVRYMNLNVVFTGYVSKLDVYALLQLCDVMLFSSKTETQGLVVVESFYCKTPAICLDDMGLKDIIIQNRGGFLVEDDEALFAKKACFLVQNKVVLAQKSQEALQVAAGFSSENMTDSMLNLYQSLKN